MVEERVFGVAIHGAGDVATQHVKAYMNNHNTKVVAISSRTEESARSFALRHGLRDAKIYSNFSKLLDDSEVDIISICTASLEDTSSFKAKSLQFPIFRMSVETWISRSNENLLLLRPMN